MLNLSSWGPSTVLVVAFSLLAAVGGLVLVVKGDLTYQQWLSYLDNFALAAGILSVGRGLYMNRVAVTGDNVTVTKD